MIKQTIVAALSALVAGSAWAADGTPAATDAQMIKQGEYLSRAGDCIACHTAKDGKPFAGGLGIESPLGTIYSTNITPDKETGIGDYTYEDFDRAVRHGVAKDGHSLYPAMPYTAYAKVTPDDVKALYAYFMHGVQPVKQANKDTDISWPLSMRWPLGVWRWMFAPDAVSGPAASDLTGADREALLRGQYLVEGLGHCSTCHTPRGFALQEKALTAADGSAFLSGGVVEGWLAKNLRGDMADGLGSWSKEDIAAFLKSGRNGHSAAFGGMAQVVGDSTQHLSDADVNAIAAYLKSLPPVNKDATQALAYDDSVAQALRAGKDKGDGAMAFLNNCAACHRSTGKGYSETFPQLALSSTVNSADPASLIHIVLKGAQMPGTAAAPTAYAMPGFDWRMTDKEVADVVTFVRSSWGNKAAAVSAADVAKVRKEVGAAPQPAR
ncbi:MULTISPECIES: c-type cytochrome [Achromobacter]|jgi:mono/diheme cytochrome c family protein|uniref:Cytochrome c n=1 Tax=Achromobacter denitrificans TaxID=32002 RepID=A0A427WUP1_ACHDE|nr:MULTISPECIES: cytochrome c [Achromobacter]MDF3849472.1 cytochrome c [Achromobacter denitrificans]MDF3857456.1 cytochrome c [Achromobacter denitrificans]MDF3938679.1 cytochrome c [Achromobacter denitrificans]OLU09349.1 alcohol dehydrogenase [Achromobacter denitrificans]QKH41626.1 cytochrome c [Achromobacter denitrificans]